MSGSTTECHFVTPDGLKSIGSTSDARRPTVRARRRERERALIALVAAASVLTCSDRGNAKPPAAPPSSAAPAPIATLTAERIARIETFVREERVRQHIPGMAVAVVKDGQLLWSAGFGTAVVEHEVPATADTVFGIAGISKFITAVAVMQCVERGQVTLDASIRDYTPEYPNKGEAITVRHVLGHTSGIRHFRNLDDYLNRKHYRSLTESVDSFKEDRLLGKPGQRFVMSTPAYNLLGLLIERLSGLSFGDYLQRNVFDPAQMKASYLDDPAALILRRAGNYTHRNGATTPADFVDPSDRFPGDGIAASVNDLARFVIALQENRLINAGTFSQMTTPGALADGSTTRYGLGCFVREAGGRTIIGHGGSQPRGAGFLLMIPGDRAAVIVLANLEQADTREVCLEIAGILLDRLFATEPQPGDGPSDP